MFNYKKYFHQASQNNVMIKIQIPSYPAGMLLVQKGKIKTQDTLKALKVRLPCKAKEY